MRRLIEAIRPLRPKQIFYACDGPVKDNQKQKELVYLTRLQINYVDWECDLRTRFRDINYGCCKGMSDAITWFFENVNAGIILEEDCIPHEDFIPYCNELLKKYEFDKRIWSINGTNFQDGKLRGDGSYYFSRYFQCWGWATWKRSWQEYDITMSAWKNLKKSDMINSIFDTKNELSYWMKIWNKLYFENKPDSWAYRFSFTSLINGGLSIIPNVNLVKNVGFDLDATNTRYSVEETSINQGIFPLSHPLNIVRHKEADQYTYTTRFSSLSLKKIIIISLKKPFYYLKKLIRLIINRY